MPGSTLVIPGITNETDLICISRSRKYGQYLKMVADTLAGRCPMCKPEHIVVAANREWWSWQSPWPEKCTKHHFIIAPRRHKIQLGDLSDSEQMMMFDIMFRLRQRYQITSSGILIRDGDARLSAGTIQHLHVHMMVPDGTGRVESPFYKGADDDARCMARAMVFEKIRTGTSPADLTESEQSLVLGLFDI